MKTMALDKLALILTYEAQNSSYVHGKYQVNIFLLLVKVWKSNHVSLIPWNAAVEVSDLNEKLQSGLFGGGGQNSLSQLWTNTSLSPNLVIHSPLLLLLTLFRKNSAEQVFVL